MNLFGEIYFSFFYENRKYLKTITGQYVYIIFPEKHKLIDSAVTVKLIMDRQADKGTFYFFAL